MQRLRFTCQTLSQASHRIVTALGPCQFGLTMKSQNVHNLLCFGKIQVVDARANTKVRPKISIVQKAHEIEDEEEAGVDDAEDDDDIKLVSKVIRKKRREKREEKHWNRSRSKITTKLENQMPSFLDPQLWHRYVGGIYVNAQKRNLISLFPLIV